MSIFNTCRCVLVNKGVIITMLVMVLISINLYSVNCQVAEDSNKRKSEIGTENNTSQNKETIGKTVDDEYSSEQLAKEEQKLKLNEYENISDDSIKQPSNYKREKRDKLDDDWDNNIDGFDPHHLYAFQLLKNDSVSYFQKIRKAPMNISLVYYVHENDVTVNLTVLDPDKKIINKIAKRKQIFIKIEAVKSGNYQFIFSRVSALIL
jgi:hypothetical protein